LEQIRKRKEERKVCATFLVRDSQNKQETKKAPRILNACTVFMHILEVCPEKCGFSAFSASCGHTKNAMIAVPPLFAQISSDASTT